MTGVEPLYIDLSKTASIENGSSSKVITDFSLYNNSLSNSVTAISISFVEILTHDFSSLYI
jgi:hypothetical protein